MTGEEIKLNMVKSAFRQLEKAIKITELTLVHDIMDDGLLYIYDGDRFIGAIQTSAFNEPEKSFN